MFSCIDRTVFDIPLTWNRTRFEATRAKCRHARKLIELSVNVQFKKQLTHIYLQNGDIKKTINKSNENLSRHETKVHVFDNLKEIASHTLPNHFDKRMKNVRTIIEEHCNAIQKVLHEENIYWKEIHSAIEQKLITSNDVRTTIDKELSDDSPTFIEETRPLSTKHKRRSVVLPPKKSNRSLPSINTSHVVKMNVSSREIEGSPIYSQPNLPAQLCFSPIFLQDEESESIRHVLSPLDQNQTNKNNEFGNLTKPKVILHRVSQKYLLEHLKIDGTNDNNNRPTSESTNFFAIPKPVRKRRLSVSADNIIEPNATAVRKRKSVSILQIEGRHPCQKRRRRIKIQKNEIPIQEPSPVSINDQSNHHNTRISARSNRLNYSGLSVSDVQSDDDYIQPESCSQLQK